MKKVLVTLVLVMTLGVSVSFAQAAPVEVPVVEKPQQSKKLVFSEIYMIAVRPDGKVPPGQPL